MGLSAYWISLSAALWLGLLTSISPCPLATNIAAVSFVAKSLDRPRDVFFAGLLYTAGRAALYALLGALLVWSLIATPYLSHFLQKYLNQVLGPLLILTGMVVLDLLQLNLPTLTITPRIQQAFSGSRLWPNFFLGALFALAFCPVSAALFFGSLLPLAIQHQSPLLIPLVYGLGTALPVLLFASVISSSVKSISSLFGAAARLELWGRRFTGVVFIAAGVYLSLVYIFEIAI